MKNRIIYCLLLLCIIGINSAGCQKKNFAVGVLPPNSVLYEMQGGKYDLYDIGKYGFVAVFFDPEVSIDQTSIDLASNVSVTHVRNEEVLSTTSSDMFSGIRWSDDGYRVMFDVNPSALGSTIIQNDSFTIELHDHKTVTGVAATGKVIIRFIYKEQTSNPSIISISPVSKPEVILAEGEYLNKYRMPPHGLIQGEFSDIIKRGTIYIDGTLLDQVPDDVKNYNFEGIAFDGSIDHTFNFITQTGWDIDTEYSFIFISERSNLHEDVNASEIDFSPIGDNKYYIMFHSNQDSGGGPLVEAVPDGSPVEDNSACGLSQSPGIGFHRQDFLAGSEPESFELIFLTSRVRIDFPQSFGYYKSENAPTRVEGVCSPDVQKISLLLYGHDADFWWEKCYWLEDEGTLIENLDCLYDEEKGIKTFEWSGLIMPDWNSIFQIRAVVTEATDNESGTGVGDIDAVTVVIDNYSDGPSIKVSPTWVSYVDPINGMDSVDIAIGGWASSEIKIYLDGDFVKSVQLPPNYIDPLYWWWDDETFDFLTFDLSIVGLSEGVHIVEACQHDAAGNTACRTDDFTVDNTPPIIEFDQPFILHNEPSPPVSLTITGHTEPSMNVWTKDEAGIERSDMSNDSDGAFEVTSIFQLFSWSYEFIFYAGDRAGNIGSASIWSFRDIDNDLLGDSWESDYGDCDSVDWSSHSDGLADEDEDGLNNFTEFFYLTNPCSSDTDGDGMPDDWELNYDLNPTDGTDGVEDADGDGLSNTSEYIYGTNPLDFDHDGDDLPDGWEVAYTLNPTDSTGENGATGDLDVDGRDNLWEYNNNTNPRRPVISILQPLPNTRVSTTTVVVNGIVDYDVTSVTISPPGIVALDLSSFSFTTTINVNPAQNTITMDAYRDTSNIGQDSINIYYDISPPTVNITAPATGTDVPTTNCIVSGTVSDPNDTYDNLKVFVNNIQAKIVPPDNWWAPVLLNPASSTTLVEAVAVDRAGNLSAPNSITLNLSPTADISAQPVTITLSPTHGQYNQPQNVTFDVSVIPDIDASSSYELDFGDGTTPATGSLSSGVATLNYNYLCDRTGYLYIEARITDGTTSLVHYGAAVFEVLPGPTEFIFTVTNPREVAIDKGAQKLYIGSEAGGIFVHENIFDDPPIPASPANVSCNPSSTLGLFHPDFIAGILYELTLADDPGTSDIFEGVYIVDLVPPGNCIQLALDYTPGTVPVDNPGGIFVDSDENIYISFSDHIDVFTPVDTIAYSFGAAELVNNPSDMLMLEGLLNVAATGSNSIMEYSVSDTGAVYDGYWTPPVWAEITAPKHINLTSENEVLLSGDGQVLIMSEDKELIALPLNGVNLTDPRGADGIERTNGSKVYFVADAADDQIVRYTIREDEQILRDMWDNFLGAVSTGDLILAGSFIHSESKEWFDDYIEKLGPFTTAISQELSTGAQLSLRWNTGSVAEFIVYMQVDINGAGPEWVAGPIRFERDYDGNWKIWLF